jgi:electron transfer flavoprotein beta subunit
MRTIVILGRVLDPSGIVVKGTAGRIFVNREEYLLQPADRCALEAALRVKAATGCEVVALPRSPLPDDDVLRQALAYGVDRAIYLAGDGFKEAYEAVMTRLLTAAIERLGGADLVLTGATTLDTGQGQLGPRLAEALGWPQILHAWQVEVVNGAARAVLKQGGEYVTVEADLPVVVTLPAGAPKLRYPNGARLINIYKNVGPIAEALERWDVADLADAEARKPLQERRGLDFPPERERGVRASGTAEEMAQAAANALQKRMRR